MMNRSTRSRFGALVLAAGALLALPLRAQPETFSAKVVAVTDGDTLGVLRDGKEIKIRLHGVDAPELSQAFGNAAKRHLSTQVFGKEVTVQAIEKDRYGRTVAVLKNEAGENLNEQLVRAGFAWWYQTYARSEKAIAEAEIAARAASRGLWKDEAPVPPWVFRRGAAALSPAESGEEAGADKPAETAVKVYLTATGDRYHRKECRYARSGGTAVTVAKAKAKGKTPCAVCKP